MKFRKIYIEITNKCNLSCSFCSKSNRELKDMSVQQFKHVINEIKPFTKTIYLHVKGEPLSHPYLDDILTVCDENEIRVNITTNATLLEKRVEVLSKHKCISKLNISLHSENKMHHYYERVFKAVDLLKNPYIVYRLWTLNEYELDEHSKKSIDALLSYYNLEETMSEKIRKEKHIVIKDKIIVDKENQFIWPNLNNDFLIEEGYCFALKTHIGILSDGSVVPCCLDGEAQLKLGNIFEESLKDILEKEKSKKIKQSFQNKKPIELLCKKCGFLQRLEVNKK